MSQGVPECSEGKPFEGRTRREIETPQFASAREGGGVNSALNYTRGDPKPVDLCLRRLKSFQQKMEGRSGSE